MNGRGVHPRVKARRDRILAVLAANPDPMSHTEVTRALGEKVSPSAVYADLRALCHSAARSYSSMRGAVNDPGYPVIWNTWNGVAATVTFALTTTARAELTAGITELEELLTLPNPTEDR